VLDKVHNGSRIAEIQRQSIDLVVGSKSLGDKSFNGLSAMVLVE
jgi:hypothetical protein